MACYATHPGLGRLQAEGLRDTGLTGLPCSCIHCGAALKCLRWGNFHPTHVGSSSLPYLNLIDFNITTNFSPVDHY